MFTKLVVLIVVGMSLSMTAPNPSTNLSADTATPKALLRLCLGPMTIGIASPDGVPVNISFDAASHGDGHAGVMHAHINPALNPFKIHLFGGESAQKLPRRLPSLP